MKKKIHLIINLLLILLFIVALFSLNFAIRFFGYQPMEQILFQLSVPMEGTSKELIDQFLNDSIYLSLIIFGVLLLFIVFCELLFKKNNISLKLKNRNIKILPIDFSKTFITIISVVLILLVALKACLYYKVFAYVEDILTSSTFIADNYVDPESVDITLPVKKRNLIYIYMESMESTYTSKEYNGDFSTDYISNLRTLATDNINFSNTSDFGGLYQVYGATWTIGGMVAQTAGVPLKVPIGGNDYTSAYSSFLGGAYTLGDILNENGYKQEFFLGSKAEFAGKDVFYEEHGNYDVVDYYKAIEKGYISSDYYEFWGYEDQKLYEFAKTELNDLSSDDQPFNFTMLTVDTHTYGGYLSSSCENKYSPQILSVISCEDELLGNFINWIKEQYFYDNTTIVITGDHLNMDSTFFDSEANRKIYNTIINSAIDTDYSKNRIATSLDMYPTILASLGANIPGNKLGLGVNLYTGEQTLAEKYGIDYLNNQLAETSVFYNKNILK